MAKIPRVFQKLFGLTGPSSEFVQFGSKNTGVPVFTKDGASIQALTAFTQNGFPDAINASNKAPWLEEMNALFLLLFQQLGSIFQDGIPAWEPSTPYYTGSLVRKDETSEIYASLIDNNVGNALPSQVDNANWKYINTTAIVPSGGMIDFGGTVAPSGWLLCDGSSYPTATYPALFAAIGYTWGGSGPNFKVPDMRGRTSIGSGTGSGLSPRSVGQSIGEETHTLVLGEIPAHSHGVTDPGHVHSEQFANILGGSGGIHYDVVTGTTNVASSAIGGSLKDTFETTLSATTGISISNSGGGGAHNNMQPSAVVLKIIKI